MEERRKNRRATLYRPIDIYDSNALLDGKTDNVSISGIGFWLAHSLPTHTELRVTIPLTPLEHPTERTLTLFAQVCYHVETTFPQKGFKIGAQFVRTEPWQLEILDAVLQFAQNHKQFLLNSSR